MHNNLELIGCITEGRCFTKTGKLCFYRCTSCGMSVVVVWKNIFLELKFWSLYSILFSWQDWYLYVKRVDLLTDFQLHIVLLVFNTWLVIRKGFFSKSRRWMLIITQLTRDIWAGMVWSILQSWLEVWGESSTHRLGKLGSGCRTRAVTYSYI